MGPRRRPSPNWQRTAHGPARGRQRRAWLSSRTRWRLIRATGTRSLATKSTRDNLEEYAVGLEKYSDTLKEQLLDDSVPARRRGHRRREQHWQKDTRVEGACMYGESDAMAPWSSRPHTGQLRQTATAGTRWGSWEPGGAPLSHGFGTEQIHFGGGRYMSMTQSTAAALVRSSGGSW